VVLYEKWEKEFPLFKLWQQNLFPFSLNVFYKLAHSLIASKPFPFASYLTFPLWHVYAITPIALWLIPPANAFSHSLQNKKLYEINIGR